MTITSPEVIELPEVVQALSLSGEFRNRSAHAQINNDNRSTVDYFSPTLLARNVVILAQAAKIQYFFLLYSFYFIYIFEFCK